jgi:M6 family metalloprotease-like protein
MLNRVFFVVLCLLCGLVQIHARPSQAGAKTRGSYNALVIFTKFQGEAQGADSAPTWADDLFNPDRPGSFTHFYDEMSRGQLQVSGQVLPKRYTSSQPGSAYIADRPGTLGKYALFNLDILRQADPDVDMGLFDNDGPDGIPNSGDDDGYVDIVFINLLTVPRDFFIGGATGLASLGLDADFISDDTAANGAQIRIRGRFNGFGGTTQRGHIFTITAATMCHEFGHVLGLPDLFDQTQVTASGEIDPAEDSAGIGKWGLMGLGTLGWGVEDGPNAFCAWALEELGWIGVDNENLVVVTRTVRDAVLDGIDSGGKVYKIPLSEDEYFLLENRQNAPSFYNRNIPAEGLLIWHVKLRADNDEERHKQVDLVCADGLFADSGFPGGAPDPVNGRDNLDFFARDRAYAAANNGNEGDATDPFDGVRFTRFAFDTNPRLSAHTGFSRNLPLGIAVDNIRQSRQRMVVDILYGQPLEGHIQGDVLWSGTVEVNGDIVVEPGAILTIEAGTTVRFARGDQQRSGFDVGRSEILVFGEIVLQGDEADPIRFVSARNQPSSRDWSGLYLLNGQDPSLLGVEFEHAVRGLVRVRLPLGTTRWRGSVDVPGDLVVPKGAELVIEPGSVLAFAGQDFTGGGIHSSLTELTVEGRLVVEGEAGNPVRFTVDANGFEPDVLWYGTVMAPQGWFEARYLQVDLSGFAFSGEVGPEGHFRLEDGLIENSFGGLDLTIKGEARIDRSQLRNITRPAIRAQGSGLLRLNEVEIKDNGQEGISLGNCSLEAIHTTVEANGRLDPMDPRSGLVASGGRGQKIELWNTKLQGNTLHGLELNDWQGRLEMHGSQISANREDGMQAGSLEQVIFEDVQVERNQGDGVVLEGALVEIWTTTLADNLGVSMVLGAGVVGVIEMSNFRNNAGLKMQGTGNLQVRSSVFENMAVALETEDATPLLTLNHFDNNLTAVKINGPAIPAAITNNTFTRNRTAIENLAAQTVLAQGNFWGTTDNAEIAALFKGSVDWTPFLNEEAQATAVEDAGANGPEAFELYPNYPNPFNAQTVIRFAIAAPVQTELIVFNSLGQAVRTLVEESLVPGFYSRIWDGRNELGRAAATGVYFYRLRAGNFRAQGRLVMVR